MSVIALEGNGVRPSHMGSGFSDTGIMYTLNTIEQHSVCYRDASSNKVRVYAVENHPNDSRARIDPDGIVQTLSSRMGTGGNNTPFVLIAGDEQMKHYWTRQSHSEFIEGNAASALKNRDYKDFTDIVQEDQMEETEQTGQVSRKYVLRRLTPTECARLQGFPDWWCDGANGSDSSQYKLWGNGVALPCVCDVLGRIAEEIRKDG